MAVCTVHIRLDLASKFPAGGTWTYNGYSSSASAGPFTDTPGTPLMPVSEDTVLTGWGDDFILNYKDKSAGYYSFTYNYTGGSDDLVINLEDRTQCAGVSRSINVSTSSGTPIDLDSYLAGTGCASPTAGGRWIDMDSAGAAFTTATGVLIPSSLSGAGTYRFKYTLVPVGFETIVCDCSQLEAIITVVAAADLVASISATGSTTCTYTASIENPDDATPGEAELEVATDAERPTMRYRYIVENCNGELVNVERTIQSGAVIMFIRNDTTDDMEIGGYYRTLRVRSTTDGDITIPLAPAGTNQATYTGVGGTTNATELTFNPSSPSIFANAIKKAILNYLGGLGYTQGTHFNLIDVAIDTTAPRVGRVMKIMFGCKHNPSSEWIGLRQADARLEYIKTPGGTLIGMNQGTRQGSGASSYETYSNAPCPRNADKLELTISIPVSLADEMAFDYDDIALISTPYTPSVSGTSEKDCDAYTLTASAVNCSGSLTYLWSTGETTSSIVQQQGTFDVTVSCSSPSSDDDASITI